MLKQVLSIQNCLPCFARTWVQIMKLCFFIHPFGAYQKLGLGLGLASVYEIKDELMLFFEAHKNTKFSFVNLIKRVAAEVGKLSDYF